jgi:hypothetical protein
MFGAAPSLTRISEFASSSGERLQPNVASDAMNEAGSTIETDLERDVLSAIAKHAATEGITKGAANRHASGIKLLDMRVCCSGGRGRTL